MGGAGGVGPQAIGREVTLQAEMVLMVLMGWLLAISILEDDSCWKIKEKITRMILNFTSWEEGCFCFGGILCEVYIIITFFILIMHAACCFNSQNASSG